MLAYTGCYFPLVTTLIGITVTDWWKLAEFHEFTDWDQKQAAIGIQFFAGILGKQLIDLSSKIPRKHSLHPLFCLTASVFLLQLFKLQRAPIHQVVYPLGQQSSGKKCTKTRACKICKSNGQRRLVRYYCYTCGLSAAYCVDFKRDCFHKHVSIITRSM